jgi:anthranilate 1,2-dioxygenase ferredoxin component
MEPGQKNQARLESGTLMSESWHQLMAVADFPDDGKLATRIGTWHVLVARLDDGFHAVNDRCTHQAALLSTGRIRRGMIMCALHGARFDLSTGSCIGGAYKSLRTFALRVMEGMIEVRIPDTPPGMEDIPIPTGPSS